MIARQRYYFIVSKKEDFLKGHRINYIANKSTLSCSYLGAILRSKKPVDNEIIYMVMSAIGYSEKEIKALKEEYFKEV